MGKRILIVDDTPLILAASKHALAGAGYDVETRSGVEDLGAKGFNGFDLILMDVQMPELYGDDIASVLRQAMHVRRGTCFGRAPFATAILPDQVRVLVVFVLFLGDDPARTTALLFQ